MSGRRWCEGYCGCSLDGHRDSKRYCSERCYQRALRVRRAWSAIEDDALRFVFDKSANNARWWACPK